MLRFLTAGESHGPELTAILEGAPAGLRLDRAALNHEMRRRQTGYGSGGRMKIEEDEVIITAGVLNGYTTGAPLALRVINRDYAKWRDRDIPPMTIPRPGHADLTGALKYGYTDLRLALERASARETAARVAVGAICKQWLAALGVTLGSYVTRIGQVQVTVPPNLPYPDRWAMAESNDVRAPTPEAAEAMRAAIWEIMQARDTLGGVFEVAALGLPPGLGSHVHWDRRLGAQLMLAVGSIHAIKGVEIGMGFEAAGRPGSQVQDELYLDADGQHLRRYTNHAGGLEGGITTGEPLIVRAAMKPISTILTPRRSVDLATGQAAPTVYERSDFCAVPRAAVVGEAMVAYVLAGALQEKLGGDTLAEMQTRLRQLRQARLSDVVMDNLPWRFGYDA